MPPSAKCVCCTAFQPPSCASTVKVLIGGQGADEVFCGYPGFQRDRWHTLLVDGRIGELIDDARNLAVDLRGVNDLAPMQV